MNINHITCLALACTLAAMTSCRENREEGYRSRTDTNDWIIATLREQYLWHETLNESANRYAEPDIYFSNVLSRTGNGKCWSIMSSFDKPAPVCRSHTNA